MGGTRMHLNRKWGLEIKGIIVYKIIFRVGFMKSNPKLKPPQLNQITI